MEDSEKKRIAEACRKSLIGVIEHIMNTEQVKKCKQDIAKIDDDTILQICAELKETGEKDGKKSGKEFVTIQKRWAEKDPEWARNLAYKEKEVQILSPEERDEFVKKIQRSSPSDVINLQREEDKFLMGLWEPEDAKEIIFIPSDLFFAKTIPLQDCRIIVDETEDGGVVAEYRVVIFDDYAENVSRAVREEDDTPIFVGAVVYTTRGKDNLFVPFCVMRGVDSLMANKVGFLEPEGHFTAKTTRGQIEQAFVGCLETWYGIQIALLHPSVKDVFRRPQRIQEEGEAKGGDGKKRRRKAKYIRKHYLRMSDFDRVTGNNGGRKFNRKCLAWYVIGHWRNYSSGKKIFIQPYWKGLLREVKANADGDDRDREIYKEVMA